MACDGYMSLSQVSVLFNMFCNGSRALSIISQSTNPYVGSTTNYYQVMTLSPKSDQHQISSRYINTSQ